jgi:hypothetical protein
MFTPVNQDKDDGSSEITFKFYTCELYEMDIKLISNKTKLMVSDITNFAMPSSNSKFRNIIWNFNTIEE